MTAEDATESTSTSTPTPTPAPTKSTARERAEARRRRILEKSKDRMSVVSGTKKVESTTISESTTGVPAPAPAPTPITEEGTAMDADAVETNNSNDTPNKDKDENNSSSAGVGGSDQNETPNGKSTTESGGVSKGSARLAQMRRRRYKKTTAASTTPATTPATSTDAPVSTNESSSSSSAAAAASTTTATAQDNENSESTKKENEVSKKESSPPPKDNEERKYLGVVKMRRKMLAEKKASEEAQAAVASATTTSNPFSKSSSSSSKATKVAPSSSSAKFKKEKKNIISLRPIIVEFITIILLFLTGFDVGVQNHVVLNQEVPTIHDNFVIHDTGLGVTKLVGGGNNADADGLPSQHPNDIITQDPFDLLEDAVGGDVDEEEEEFNDSTKQHQQPMGASTSSTMKEPNIDPVFGVDFDELTQGDSIFLTLVRAAVSIHRMLTYLFFTLPMSFFSTIFALPRSLIVNPPILFLSSVIIRYLGKHVFGGSIPDLDKMLEAEISDNDGMKPKESVAEGIANTDFASMGTNFVKNFAKTNFPKLVLVYTIFADARSDMFVVLCGFFLGLVLPSDLLGWYGSSFVTSVSEEL